MRTPSEAYPHHLQIIVRVAFRMYLEIIGNINDSTYVGDAVNSWTLYYASKCGRTAV